MPLTDLFIRKLKHSGKPSGDKYNDGRALYLLVRESNKYWRMNYRFEGKHKTLALGIYPEVSLAEARELCADARKLLRAGADPKPKKPDQSEQQDDTDQNTFEALALQWLAKMAASRRAATKKKVQAWLWHAPFAFIGAMSAATIKPRDILGVIQREEEAAPLTYPHQATGAWNCLVSVHIVFLRRYRSFRQSRALLARECLRWRYITQDGLNKLG